MKRLLMDDDVTKNAGIIRYLLSDRTKHDEKFLSIRHFQKRRREGHMKDRNANARFVERCLTWQRWTETILYRGARAAGLWMKICRCCVRNVIMRKVIDNIKIVKVANI